MYSLHVDVKNLFRGISKSAKRKAASGSEPSCYILDFLAGNQNYNCTPWGNLTRNGGYWQKLCYLLADEGNASSFQELIDTTPWDKYGTVKIECAKAWRIVVM